MRDRRPDRPTRRIRRRGTPGRRAAQNVLRADVAVHQRAFVGLRRRDEFVDPRRKVGMRAPGRHQVGFQPDVDRRCGRSGNPPRRWVRGGGGVDPSEGCRHPGGECRIGVAVAQLRFPQRMVAPAAGIALPRSRWLRRGRAAPARRPGPRHWRAASSVPRSDCARPARASPPPPAVSPAPASRRSARREGRCARCRRRRRRSAVPRPRRHRPPADPCGAVRRVFQRVAFRSVACGARRFSSVTAGTSPAMTTYERRASQPKRRSEPHRQSFVGMAHWNICGAAALNLAAIRRISRRGRRVGDERCGGREA